MPADSGAMKSRSPPHASNDNPFSKAHVKTLKYQPEFPGRLVTIAEARSFCRRFLARYNADHHPAGAGSMTPGPIPFGQARAIHAARQQTLELAVPGIPERFVRKPPEPPHIPTAVRINPSGQPEQNQT